MPGRAQFHPGPRIEPLDAFARLASRRDCFWLDSSLRRARDGRFSVMGCEPRWVFAARGASWQISNAAETGEEGIGDPLRRLDALLDSELVLPPSNDIGLPFYGGAVGWLSYDLGRQFETIGLVARDDLETPDVRLAWYDAALVWDHETGESWTVTVGGNRGREANDRLIGRLREPPEFSDPASCGEPGIVRSNTSRDEYLTKVSQVREGIARGEYYQVNLVQRFVCDFEGNPAGVYLRLRAANPAPFSAYISAGEWTLSSSSPERFIEVGPEGAIRTCPIKGTRARHRDPESDRAQRRELLASAKERAELLMIVDLLRNDLGRICETGSVEVKRMHSLETFATVHHLVGEISGRLHPGLPRRDLLRAIFPGGSITGAPKVSAMRAIERLEPHRRGIGMGSLGYFSAHGRIDFNIAIRSIIFHGGRAFIPAGAGIVWDSDPAAEYEETLIKAGALFAAVGAGCSHSATPLAARAGE